MLSALDAPVQTGEAAVDRVAQDVRDRLARPSPAGLRPIPVPVELLADLGDPLALEAASEDQGDHTGLLLLQLEYAGHLVVPAWARVGEECVRLLDGVVQGFDALQSSGPPQHLALVQIPLHAD